MKKINISKACNVVSILLLLGFIIHTIVDYNRYYNTSILTAAPFYLRVVVNIVCFIAPAIIAFVIGLVIEKRRSQNHQV